MFITFYSISNNYTFLCIENLIKMAIRNWKTNLTLSDTAKKKVKDLQATSQLKGASMTQDDAVDYIINNYQIKNYEPKTFKK